MEEFNKYSSTYPIVEQKDGSLHTALINGDLLLQYPLPLPLQSTSGTTRIGATVGGAVFHIFGPTEHLQSSVDQGRRQMELPSIPKEGTMSTY